MLCWTDWLESPSVFGVFGLVWGFLVLCVCVCVCLLRMGLLLDCSVVGLIASPPGVWVMVSVVWTISIMMLDGPTVWAMLLASEMRFWCAACPLEHSFEIATKVSAGLVRNQVDCVTSILLLSSHQTGTVSINSSAGSR